MNTCSICFAGWYALVLLLFPRQPHLKNISVTGAHLRVPALFDDPHGRSRDAGFVRLSRQTSTAVPGGFDAKHTPVGMEADGWADRPRP